MEQRSFIRSFAVLVFALGLLLAYPLAHDECPWLSRHFRSYDPLGWIWLSDASTDTPEDAALPFDTLEYIPLDTLRTESDTASLAETILPGNAFSSEQRGYHGSDHLRPFLQALSTGGEQVRIAYFGDSSVEGDLISQTLRDSLQQRFGGEGVGFVPILPAVQNFRRSVRQSASNNWYQYKAGRRNYKALPVGITAGYFTAMNNWEFMALSEKGAATYDTMRKPSMFDSRHWVTFSASSFFDGARRFPRVRLFFGRPSAAAEAETARCGQVTLKSADHQTDIPLFATALINAIDLPVENSTQLRLEFSIPNNLPVYGVSMESPTGVILDNFSMRGNSGSALSAIPQPNLQAFQDLLDYKLVILQFGLNVLNPKLLDYRWYENQMIELIAHFRQAMPEACILVVGLQDKGVKMDGVMRSDPSVARITEAQRRAAFRCGVAFFSLYEAMGGEGSMVEWVEKRKLASKDYTHFNFEGADVASNFVLHYLLNGISAPAASR